MAGSFPPDLLIGEWFFADDVFGDSIPDQSDYLEKILIRVIGPGSTLAEELTVARKARARYLDDCVQAVHLRCRPPWSGSPRHFIKRVPVWRSPNASSSLRIPPVIVFGGANCEGEMGLQMLRSFPWIDYVCCGESDRSFVASTRGIASTPRCPEHSGRARPPELQRGGAVGSGAGPEPASHAGVRRLLLAAGELIAAK